MPTRIPPPRCAAAVATTIAPTSSTAAMSSIPSSRTSILPPNSVRRSSPVMRPTWPTPSAIASNSPHA
ncbi:hypothetical protein HYQ46_013123 [Verticillium longisporum]|nr:hypothetical protein HYQ46_013123 [Verticillium longisporum]